MTDFAWLLPAVALLAALAGPVAGGRSRRAAAAVAVAGAAAVAVLAVALAVAAPRDGSAAERSTLLTPTGTVPVTLGTYVDGLTAAMVVLVAAVALAVQVYSTSYLLGDARYSSYAALVSLFTAAMLLVVLSGDLVVLLVGWEVMGICSYFLIGHDWEYDWAQAAAVKAFLMTKLGDVPFLIGIVVLGLDAGTFEISGIIAAHREGGLEHLTAATLLLLGGVIGKSAQFPLHTWLPDAMAGPTPVSALIHAATMVAAGIYVLARLWPLYAAAPDTRAVLAAVAAVTMLGAALAALAQDDVKRVLAYSTVSQLAYMAGGLAVGGRDAAVFHLLDHGAFKALLFLGAGALIHAAATNDMAQMGGLRRAMPVTFATMTVGLASLAGLPPFAGFFSKDAVLAAAEHARGETGAGALPGWAADAVLLSGLATVLVTAAYAARLWLRVFFGEQRAPAAPGGAHDAPPAMALPLVALAVPAGLLGLAYAWVPDWLRSPGVQPGHLTPELRTALISTVLALMGIAATWRVWSRYPGLDPALALGRLRRACECAFGVDRLYDRVFVRPFRRLVRGVLFTDRVVIDSYVDGSGRAATLAGALLRRTQAGNVQAYLTGLVALVLVAALFVVGGV
jgi:NADH-quinone oxidoreductase subunit L